LIELDRLQRKRLIQFKLQLLLGKVCKAVHGRLLRIKELQLLQTPITAGIARTIQLDPPSIPLISYTDENDYYCWNLCIDFADSSQNQNNYKHTQDGLLRFSNS